MASYSPKNAAEFIFYVSLEDTAAPGYFKANPTLASGDVKISKDGGALANLNTLPTVTPAAGKAVKVTLSAMEMTADNVLVVFSDAAGAEWNDLVISLHPQAKGHDDLASQAGVDDLPTNAELATALGTADDAVLAAIAALNNLSQANIRSAVGLGSANLDTQLDALPTNAELATALAAADDAVLAAIAALSIPTAAQNAAAVAAEAITELATVPGASPTLKQAMALLYMALRNKVTVTSSQKKIHNDAGAVLATKALTDDGTTYTEDEAA